MPQGNDDASSKTGSAILDMADDLVLQGSLDEAMDLLNQARKSTDTIKDPHLFARILFKLGYVSILMAQWSMAEDFYLAAGEIIEPRLEETAWQKLAQELYIAKGFMFWRLGNYLDAEEYLNKAISISKDEDILLGKAYLEMGNVLAEKGETEAAIKNLLHAIEILSKTDDKNELARAYNNISDAFKKNSDFDSAVLYADKCIAKAVEKGNKRQEGFGYLTGGESLVKKGDVKKARQYLESARTAFGHAIEPYIVGSLLLLEGIIVAKEHNFKQALAVFEEAKKKLALSNIPYYLALVYHEEGGVYKNMGNIILAKRCFEDALKIFRDHRCLADIRAVKRDLNEIEKIERKSK